MIAAIALVATMTATPTPESIQQLEHRVAILVEHRMNQLEDAQILLASISVRLQNNDLDNVGAVKAIEVELKKDKSLWKWYRRQCKLHVYTPTPTPVSVKIPANEKDKIGL